MLGGRALGTYERNILLSIYGANFCVAFEVRDCRKTTLEPECIIDHR
jgi:hypothetical protein